MHGHIAAHHLAKAACQGEAQTGAAELARRGSIGLGKVLEQFENLVGTQADASVRNAKHDPLEAIHRVAFGIEGDVALTSELGSVGQQIEQTLAHLDLIGVHRAQFGRAPDVKRVGVFAHHRLDGRGDFVDHFGEVETFQKQFHLASLNFRQIQNVVDEGQQMFSRRMDFLQIGHEILQLLIESFFLQHF